MFQITATCVNHHSQTIRFSTDFSREWVEMQAELLDGSSDMYIYPPGPDSVIGSCGICQSKFKCTVNEIPEVLVGTRYSPPLAPNIKA